MSDRIAENEEQDGPKLPLHIDEGTLYLTSLATNVYATLFLYPINTSICLFYREFVTYSTALSVIGR